MNSEQISTIELCSKAPFTGEMSFPNIIERLCHAGVERYHADYSRREKTYYLATGESYVVPFPDMPGPVGQEFRTDEIIAALRRSQRNEHTYADFIRDTVEAGCVGYFVQITGKRALYFGRNGEIHTELFPSAVASL